MKVVIVTVIVLAILFLYLLSLRDANNLQSIMSDKSPLGARQKICKNLVSPGSFEIVNFIDRYGMESSVFGMRKIGTNDIEYFTPPGIVAETSHSELIAKHGLTISQVIPCMDILSSNRDVQ